MSSARAQKVVVAALIRAGATVLVSQRRADQSFPLCWEFPGGKIEPGESAEQALIREIREELGCAIAVGALFHRVTFAYEDFDLDMALYECTVVSGTPHAVEVAAVDWVIPTVLATLKMPPADLPMVELLTKGRAS
ncbi:MAG: (deoxy)nucleoside triphosphate pyrophosphohydrolase [Deltaproteobacteria bacterium]|nr:(deoxy)nucleoside triphosphate pyrophosphohydrolase [Deltaproteobacteria bacterium]